MCVWVGGGVREMLSPPKVVLVGFMSGICTHLQTGHHDFANITTGYVVVRVFAHNATTAGSLDPGGLGPSDVAASPCAHRLQTVHGSEAMDAIAAVREDA